jgi:hypothetical protein
MTKKAKSIKEVLIAARWILDNVGWCQNTYTKNKSGISNDTPGNMIDLNNVSAACLLGAVHLVETNSMIRSKAFNMINDRLYNIEGRYSLSWNDDPRRTKDQVLFFLDKIIKEA